MPTSDSKIPNLPLNGQELKEVVINSADELVAAAHESLMFALRGRMDNDAVFAKTYTHPRVRVSLALKFHFSNRHLPETEFQITTGEKPHETNDAAHFVEATDRELSIDNPNLERLAAGIPFTETSVERPAPGEIIGKLKTTEIPVSKEDYPKPDSSVDTDVTDREVSKLGIPAEKIIGKKKKHRGGPK